MTGSGSAQSPAAPVASVPPRGLSILGDPVDHSLSPVFQQAALDAVGIPVRYERTRVDAVDVPAVLEAWRRSGMAGNITMPHKALVATLVDERSAVSQRTGAVNTVWVDRGRLVGHNTDVDGVVATIRSLCPTGIDGSVVVIGAGGAAAAVLLALEQCGMPETVVVARRADRAHAMVARIGIGAGVATYPMELREWGGLFDGLTAQPALIVNASPIGMSATPSVSGHPVPVEGLPRGAACFDLVYQHGETAWVRAARAAGHPAEDGLRMLVEQGAAAFECWFGRAAPRAIMWQAVGRAPVATP